MEPVLAPASLLAIVVLSVYGATIAPSIAGGDSGELVAEACHLGTAHPPGYPLFTLLIHALTRLPGVPASPAVRANLFCAACGAGAAAPVARCVPPLCLCKLRHAPGQIHSRHARELAPPERFVSGEGGFRHSKDAQP